MTMGGTNSGKPWDLQWKMALLKEVRVGELLILTWVLFLKLEQTKLLILGFGIFEKSCLARGVIMMNRM